MTRSIALCLPVCSIVQLRGDKQQRVFLRADKTVPYGELMSLMNELRGAGYLHVALVGLEAEKL